MTRFPRFAGLLLWLGTLCSLPLYTLSASADEPHPHNGVVQPFQAGDPGVKLDRAAEALLRQDKPYQTQIQSGTAGRGLVVQDVKAPTDVVWDRILDFNNYHKMVPKTMESSIYKHETSRGGAQRIWVRMKVGFTPAPRLVFFVNHLYQPALHSMTWTLDYARKSDFDDSCGYWYVVPHPDNKEWSRVYYSVQVSMFSWVPQFVVDFMSQQALTDATGWVKKQSELQYAKKGGGTAKIVSPPATTTTTEDNSKEAKTPKNRPLSRWFGSKKGTSTHPATPAHNKQAEDTATPVTAKPSPATITRYILASTAVALVGANVYLFVSQ